MASRTLPNLGLDAFFALGEDGWDDEISLNFLKLSILSQAGAASKVSATPGAPSAGDVHIFDETHPTQANKVAVFDDGVWKHFTPLQGWLVYNRGAGAFELFTGTVWDPVVFGSGVPDAPADGDLYARRDNAWEAFTPGGGGGGGGGAEWTVLYEWTHAVDGNVVAPVVSGIDANEILVVMVDCVLQNPVGTAFNTALAVQVSTDNGATFISGPTEHLQLQSNNATIPDGYIRATAAASTAARSMIAHILNAKAAAPKMVMTNADPMLLPNTLGVIDAIRIQPRSTSLGTFTAGKICVLGR